MADRVENLPATEGPATVRTSDKASRIDASNALELVALRGRDVIGVRHLMQGARASVGGGPDALARVSMKDFGGTSVIVGEVTQQGFIVRVPPRARARVHEATGLARLLFGPDEIMLGDGERAVILVGPVTIRAKIVAVPAFSKKARLSGALRWVALIGALYVLALTVCALLSQNHAAAVPRPPPPTAPARSP